MRGLGFVILCFVLVFLFVVCRVMPPHPASGHLLPRGGEGRLMWPDHAALISVEALQLSPRPLGGEGQGEGVWAL